MKIMFSISLRAVIGTIFVAAGISKLIDAQLFLAAIRQIRFLPSWLIHPAGILVLQSEIWIGLGLVSGFRPRLMAGLLSALLILFIIVALFVSLDGHTGECGCFGPLMKENFGIGVILRDLLLLGGCAWLWFWGELRPASTKIHSVESFPEKLSENRTLFMN
jgi:uncharacterized membrane protein YphA (DoxX/SURF4 family)